jgi:putative peptide zinc metalloprotease protein
VALRPAPTVEVSAGGGKNGMTAAVTESESARSDSVGAQAKPRLAPGVELLGPYRDSGLQDPPFLVRRAARILQISRLLHTVAASADGTRDVDEMAAVAGAGLDRPLTGEQVAFLVRHKLAPAGILVLGDEAASAALDPPAPDQRLLALRFRRPMLSAEAIEVGARALQQLFRAPVVATVLAGVMCIDAWLFGVHGVRAALDQVARTPGLILVLLALVMCSGVFHEMGHAAGCRYSGGRSGAAGVGLYLWWPVMYTNVTDAYRLDRRGRLRTDLGGIYFNGVFTLALGAAYAATAWEPLLAVIVLEHVLVVHQLIPFVRLDGYYIVSDLTGVPDILSRVRPALRSLIPGRPTDPAVVALRPSSRRILFGYLVSLALFVVVVVVPTLLLLPKTFAANATALLPHLDAMRAAAGQWDAPLVLVRASAVALLALPLVGMTLTGALLATRLVQKVVSPRKRVRRRVRFDPSDLAVVEGTEMPAGGAVDYFGFGPAGELVLFGKAVGCPPQEVADRLVAAGRTLHRLSADGLDRLLLEGPPFVEVVAGRARQAGHTWDEQAFRAGLDGTLARGDFRLFVLEPSRSGATLRVYPVTIGAKRHKTGRLPRIGTSARKSYNEDCVRAPTSS